MLLLHSKMSSKALCCQVQNFIHTIALNIAHTSRLLALWPAWFASLEKLCPISTSHRVDKLSGYKDPNYCCPSGLSNPDTPHHVAEQHPSRYTEVLIWSLSPLRVFLLSSSGLYPPPQHYNLWTISCYGRPHLNVNLLECHSDKLVCATASA